jgi:hypothetical protein
MGEPNSEIKFTAPAGAEFEPNLERDLLDASGDTGHWRRSVISRLEIIANQSRDTERLTRALEDNTRAILDNARATALLAKQLRDSNSDTT